MDNIKKLIKEGKMGIQDKFMDMFIDIKKSDPNLNKNQIINLIGDEFDRFIKFHSVVGDDIIKTNTEKKVIERGKSINPNKGGKVFYDKIPTRKIPYGK